jgi:ABC-2 type transport system permease protein
VSAFGTTAGRLSIWQAAWVIARRDFVAILFSRAFIFFLLGPLFPIVVGGLAGTVGSQVEQAAAQPQIGIAMNSADADAMLAAHGRLAAKLGPVLPEMVVLKRLEPGETFDAKAVLTKPGSTVSGVVTGTPAKPEFTATTGRVEWWKGTVELIAADALAGPKEDAPAAATQAVASSGASERTNRLRTAQAGLVLLFLLIMLLAGMVLSNLVEEKGNKIIEILAAAIPMDAVFLGKLFAMLGVSFVGITVWGTAGFVITELSGGTVGAFLDGLTAPGVGWPLFFLFGVIYFAMGYLLLGSIFLAVGSMATTVREVQTLSMPATMAQLLVFFFANYALSAIGKPVEWAAIAFPLSSPYAMLSRAAIADELWPHLVAIAWQAMWVAIFIKVGAGLFRRRVMQSGPQAVKKKRRGLFSRGKAAPEPGQA